MRGGGGSELASYLQSGENFTWYNRKFASSRLEGGGCGGCAAETYPTTCCGKGKQRNGIGQKEGSVQWDSPNPAFLAANRCKLRNEDKCENKPSCSCPAGNYLEAALKKKGNSICTKKPCMGTDCLIKAFKDAQEFVDSIGKVPGLAGLGISESPYFGSPPEQREIKKTESKPTETIPNLYNQQNFDLSRRSSLNTTPNIAPPSGMKRSGVVQEGTPIMPNSSMFPPTKTKKKEEKVDTESNSAPAAFFEETPCGEPKCKSRPKKKAQTTDSIEKIRPFRGPSGDKKKTRSSSKQNQFIYNYGDNYPTSVYGHKDCSKLRTLVPPNMGWIWNEYDPIAKLKPRTGWRPGAISTSLRDMLREAKLGFFKQIRPRSAPSRSKKGKLQKTISVTTIKKKVGRNEEEAEEDVEFPPTLHIHRKDGVYYVTMYPIRQDTTDVPRLDEPINPLQFKIVKSKESIASSSTASDMEIEFSPPAAVNRLKKQPNLVHVETQVKAQEILDATKKKEVKGKGGKPKKK